MKKLSVQEFILNEVTEYIKANMFPLRNRYAALTVAENMPSFGTFISTYYMESMNGAQFPVDIENLYINSDDYEEMYNEIIINSVSNLVKKA
ncbi:hypothetical protein BV57P2_00024 [Phocaeicola phage BV57P2]|nr:hypothetical protein BV57P2_00024 [Phocaeicola phage BV57P2]WAX10848.1 hypothetical protein BV739P1_00049 [Phocaeicola phage BV739P1]